MQSEAELSEFIAPVVKELRNPRSTVVVHCRTGQISASLIASILILAGGMTLHEAASLLESDKNWRGRENLKQPVHRMAHQQLASISCIGRFGVLLKRSSGA